MKRSKPAVIWMRPERGTRGPKPAFSRDDVAAAAVRIADAEGIEAVSMRRIATELGAGTASLYRYVAKKDDVFELMIDAVVGEVGEAEGAKGWRATLRALAYLWRQTSLRHPWFAILTSARSPLGPNSLGWLERTLAAFDG